MVFRKLRLKQIFVATLRTGEPNVGLEGNERGWQQ